MREHLQVSHRLSVFTPQSLRVSCRLSFYILSAAALSEEPTSARTSETAEKTAEGAGAAGPWRRGQTKKPGDLEAPEVKRHSNIEASYVFCQFVHAFSLVYLFYHVRSVQPSRSDLFL